MYRDIRVYATLNIQTTIFENDLKALGISTKIIIFMEVCFYIAGM